MRSGIDNSSRVPGSKVIVSSFTRRRDVASVGFASGDKSICPRQCSCQVSGRGHGRARRIGLRRECQVVLSSKLSGIAARELNDLN